MSSVTGKPTLLLFQNPFMCFLYLAIGIWLIHFIVCSFAYCIGKMVRLSFGHSPIWFIPANAHWGPYDCDSCQSLSFSPLQSMLPASQRFHTGINPVHLFPPLFWFVNQYREILILNLWCNSLVSIYFNLVNTCISLCFIFYLVSQGVEVLVARKSKGK